MVDRAQQNRVEMSSLVSQRNQKDPSQQCSTSKFKHISVLEIKNDGLSGFDDHLHNLIQLV